MKYSLRSLMIAGILGPPMLAATWVIGGQAISKYRERQGEEEWTDVGGPGTVAEFSTNIGCFVDEDNPSAVDSELTDTSVDPTEFVLPTSSALAPNPPKP